MEFRKAIERIAGLLGVWPWLGQYARHDLQEPGRSEEQGPVTDQEHTLKAQPEFASQAFGGLTCRWRWRSHMASA